MPATFFVSDLHLTPARPEINRVFFDFLRGPGREAEALYILGDLFEYWVGDDDLPDPFNSQIAGALRELSSTGVPIHFMVGNRDVLLRRGFARAAGLSIIPDPTIVNLYGTHTLLMHGDSLCTDDRTYQAFRKRARNPLVQFLFLLQPLAVRKSKMERGRKRSEAHKRANAPEIMDVNPAAVEAALRNSGCDRLIHGHTHRPARHELTVNGRSCERWVLSDWYRRGQYLRISPESLDSIDLPVLTL